MIGVIGSGSWATGIVKILLEKADREVCWWVRNKEIRDSIKQKGYNPKHLPEAHLDSTRLVLPDTLSEVVEACSDLFIAIPSAYVAEVLGTLPKEAYEGKNIISAVKGVIPDKRVSVSVYLEKMLKVKRSRICVISGPTHAEEAGRGMPTFLTMASANLTLAIAVEQMMQCSYLHTSHTNDIWMLERVGLLKNIYAICAGICQGLGYGDNLNAVMVSAAARELNKLTRSVGPTPINVSDNCFLGDLMVTCWSHHSRNRRLGEEIAHGRKLDDIFKEMGMMAEGYFSAKNYHELGMMAGKVDEMPIAEAVYRILYEETDPRTEIEYLIDHVF